MYDLLLLLDDTECSFGHLVLAADLCALEFCVIPVAANNNLQTKIQKNRLIGDFLTPPEIIIN